MKTHDETGPKTADEGGAPARFLLDCAIQLLALAHGHWYGDTNGRQLWLAHTAQAFYAAALKLGLGVSGQLDYAFAANSVRYGEARGALPPHLDHTREMLLFLFEHPDVADTMAAVAGGETNEVQRRGVMNQGRGLAQLWGDPASYHLAFASFVLGEAARMAAGGGDGAEYVFFEDCYVANRTTYDLRRSATNCAAFILRLGVYRDHPPGAPEGNGCDMAHYFRVRQNLRLRGEAEPDAQTLAA